MDKRLRYLLPNLLTALSSASALLAIEFAYRTHQKTCVYFIMLSGLLDTLDGPLARKLGAQSRFGNFYDSMSDFLAFGVAPAACLWILGYLHPIVAAFYVLCIQLRLTRFSAKTVDTQAKVKYFQGISSPDAVYVGTFLGMIPFSNLNLGFSIAALLAICPWPLMPKGYNLVKYTAALGTLFYFIYRY